MERRSGRWLSAVSGLALQDAAGAATTEFWFSDKNKVAPSQQAN